MNVKAILAIGLCALLLTGGFCLGYRTGFSAGADALNDKLAAERFRGDELQRTIDRITNAGPGDLQRIIDYQRAIGGIRSANSGIGGAVDRAGEGLGDILRILDELERRENQAGN